MFPATTGWQTTTPASCRRCRIRRAGIGRRRIASLALALSLAACRSVPTQAPTPPSTGEVDAQPLLAASADRYEVAEGATYAQPQAAADNALPVYPADLLAQRLAPRIVRVRLIVDAQGRVGEVRALDPDPGDAFLEAIRTACATWRFSPLAETRAVERRRRLPDGDVEIEYVPETRTLPFHLDYRFAFRQVDGRPVVDGGTADAAEAPSATPAVAAPDLR